MTDGQQEDLTIDYGHGETSVEICPAHSLGDVRKLMLEEFDEDMKTYMKVWPILRLAVRVGLGERPVAS